MRTKWPPMKPEQRCAALREESCRVSPWHWRPCSFAARCPGALNQNLSPPAERIRSPPGQRLATRRWSNRARVLGRFALRRRL